MKLKYEFTVMELGGAYTAVPIGEEADGLRAIIQLNREGYEVFSLLTQKESVTLDWLLDELGRRFDESTPEEIREKTLRFLRWLQEENLLLTDENLEA